MKLDAYWRRQQISCSMCPIFSAVLGNAWANENMFTAAEGIIWFRYHNYVASRLREEHPAWSDEALFQNARKTVVATFQVGGKIQPLPGPCCNLHPGRE